MKKIVVLAMVIVFMALPLVAAFAVEKQGPTSTQHIAIVGDPVKSINAEIDKAQPPKPQTARFILSYETFNGRRGQILIHAQLNDKGEITKADIVSSPIKAKITVVAKAAGGGPMPVPKCEPGCSLRTATTCIIYFPSGRKVCWDWYYCCCPGWDCW